MTMELPKKPRQTKRQGRHPDKALSAAFCRTVAESGRYTATAMGSTCMSTRPGQAAGCNGSLFTANPARSPTARPRRRRSSGGLRAVGPVRAPPLADG